MSNTDFDNDFGPVSNQAGAQTSGLPRASGKWDKQTICNRALIASANTPVTTPDDGSDEWRVASTAYDRHVPNLLRYETWAFATLISDPLQRLGDSLEPGYGDVFAKPDNCLFLDAVWRLDLAALVWKSVLGIPSDRQDTNPPPLDYAIVGDQIHTNADQGAVARYIPFPDETAQPWSVGFVEVLTLLIEAACFDALNEDFAQGAARMKRAQEALALESARNSQETPRRVAFRSGVLERRRYARTGWYR